MPFRKTQFLGDGKNEAGQQAVRNFRDVDFEKEARRVLDDAAQKGALIERDAYQAGFAKGEQAGIRLGKESMTPVLDQLRQALAELAVARQKMLLAMEPKIAALAVDIAEKILRIEIDRNDEAIRAAVREAVAQSTDRGEIDVILAPGDLRVIEELRPELMEIKGVEKIRLLADDRISPGGCRIEASSGSVDATVETAMKEIRTLVE